MKTKEIKELRVQLDSFLSGLSPDTRSWAMAITSIEFARMWLGKVCHYLGDEYPYPDSMNPSNTVIADAVDLSPDKLYIPEELNDQIIVIKQLRKIIAEKVEMLKSYQNKFVTGDDGWIALLNSRTYLQEVNMCFGMRLAEIKKEMFEPKKESQELGDLDLL